MSIKALEINQNSWKTEVLDKDIPVLVDFYAAWCGPCKMLSPTIDKLAKDFEGRVSVVKINTDLAIDIATMYGVSAMPSVYLFNKGKLISRIVGVNPESKYRDQLNKVITQEV